jgi:nucleotide-binding universal stress UspA family protein
MIKDMLVGLSLSAERDPAAAYALSMAAEFKAHVTGVAFAFEVIIPEVAPGGFSAGFIEESRAEGRKAAAATVARFEAAAKKAGAAIETRIVETSMVGAAEMFGRLARRFDLSVAAQSPPDKALGEDLLIEAALFQSGRPVVVVPYIQKDALALGRVLVAWDGGQTAARAIGDALPFLKRAKAVDIVIVATSRARQDETAGTDMARHLARHDLKVEIRRIVADDVNVANMILSHASDSGADFIVMGGYGHSRLREFILGGATRGILQQLTLPVLMAH